MEAQTLVEFLSEPLNMLMFCMFIGCCIAPLLHMVWSQVIKYFVGQIMSKVIAANEVTLLLFFV